MHKQCACHHTSIIFVINDLESIYRYRNELDIIDFALSFLAFRKRKTQWQIYIKVWYLATSIADIFGIFTWNVKMNVWPEQLLISCFRQKISIVLLFSKFLDFFTMPKLPVQILTWLIASNARSRKHSSHGCFERYFNSTKRLFKQAKESFKKRNKEIHVSRAEICSVFKHGKRFHIQRV